MEKGEKKKSLLQRQNWRERKSVPINLLVFSGLDRISKACNNLW